MQRGDFKTLSPEKIGDVSPTMCVQNAVCVYARVVMKDGKNDSN